MTKVNVYLAFNGTCEAAFNFYKSVFGGEFSYVGHYKDMPPSDQPIPDSEREKIMHISLPVSSETMLMGCDLSEASMGQPLVAGNNFSICISTPNEAESRRIFDALAEDGVVTMPLEKTFFSPLFGMLVDKFGIAWMVDVEVEIS
ncbi:MAG: VOC family protein [Bacteroidales bacterium]|jgi:PhnB protein|nr:VOC family protein [Bacteroidales bacterium]